MVFRAADYAQMPPTLAGALALSLLAKTKQMSATNIAEPPEGGEAQVLGGLTTN
jgi:hypothetical protein